MTGTIAGDVVGSPYKYLDTQDEYFEIGSTVAGLYSNRAISQEARMTDNSLMTLAVMRWLSRGDGTADSLVAAMRDMYSRYPGTDTSAQMKGFLSGESVAVEDSYNHLVRAAVVGLSAGDLEEALSRCEVAVGVTTSSEEDMKAGKAVCQAVWMASHCDEKFDIVLAMRDSYGLDLSMPLDSMRPSFVRTHDQVFSVSKMLETVDRVSDPQLYMKMKRAASAAMLKHQDSFTLAVPYRVKVDSMQMVQAALVAFIEARGFENGVRRSVTVGGDSSVIASLTGALMEASEGQVPSKFEVFTKSFMDSYQAGIVDSFERKVVGKEEGMIPPRANDSFQILKVGGDVVASNAYKTEHVEAVKAKYGDVRFVPAGELKEMEADFRKGHDRPELANSAHLAGAPVQVRTLYLNPGKGISGVTGTTSPSVTTSAKAREKARKDFLDLRMAALDVVEAMNRYAGNRTGRDIITVQANRVEVYDDKVVGYRGQGFADEIGISPTTGLLYRHESNDAHFGEYSSSDKMIRRMFDGAESYDALSGRVTVNVRNAIASMRLLCLDEGENENLAEEKDETTGLSVDSTPYYGEQTTEYRTNLELLDDDLARSEDEELQQACSIGVSQSAGRGR